MRGNVHDMTRHAATNRDDFSTSHEEHSLPSRNIQEFDLSGISLRLLLQLYIDLYEHGVIELTDVQIAATWVRDVKRSM